MQCWQAQNFLSHTSRQLLYCTKRLITWRDAANLAHSTWDVGRLCKAKSGICARSPTHIPPQIRLDTANTQICSYTNIATCCFYIKCNDLSQRHNVAMRLCIGCIGALHAGILCVLSQQAGEDNTNWPSVYLYANVICLNVHCSSSLLVQQGDNLD